MPIVLMGDERVIKMTMTLREKRILEIEELQKRREKEQEELKNELETSLNNESIEVISMREDDEESYKVVIAFTLDGFKQEDDFYWNGDESKEDFIKKVKLRIDYIKELREQYHEYCKQNDYIQTNSKFRKEINLTHMGYNKTSYIDLQLADYLKLPNTTSTGFGGGDYQIKRTPERVKEFNRNIDIAIDVLLDCIAELKQRKYKDS